MAAPETLKRVLMGPDPSDVDPRVLEALSRPTIGHPDPAFLDILNKIRWLLQYTFQTRNDMTFAVSGTDDITLRKQLLDEFNIEIGGGLGAFKAKAWRIGLMGSASTLSNIMLLLSALEKCLADQGVKFKKGASIAAAIDQAEQVA